MTAGCQYMKQSLLLQVYRNQREKLKKARCSRHSRSSLAETYQMHAWCNNGYNGYGYVNPGLDSFDFGEDFISNPLNEKGCADILMNEQAMHDEFLVSFECSVTNKKRVKVSKWNANAMGMYR